MLHGACQNRRITLSYPHTLGACLNAICRPPHDPFDRVLEETLRKVLRYRNQSVHDGIILPVPLVREYLRAMDHATITLESAGFFSSSNSPNTTTPTTPPSHHPTNRRAPRLGESSSRSSSSPPTSSSSSSTTAATAAAAAAG